MCIYNYTYVKDYVFESRYHLFMRPIRSNLNSSPCICKINEEDWCNKERDKTHNTTYFEYHGPYISLAYEYVNMISFPFKLIWEDRQLKHLNLANCPGYVFGGCHCFKVISHMSEVVYISSFPFSILLKDNKIMKCSTFGMGMAGFIIVFQWLYLYKICHHCKFHSWLLRCKHQPTQCQLFGYVHCTRDGLVH